jgi:hypothetical protein
MAKITSSTAIPAVIKSNGFGGYSICHGIMKSCKDYKTVEGAVRQAKARGFDPVTVDPGCDPSLRSVARLCKYYEAKGSYSMAVLCVTLDKFGDQNQIIEFKGVDAIKLANEFFPKMGWKPVRLTSNMLNAAGGQFLIDADTPSYCDPGSEAYHSM